MVSFYADIFLGEDGFVSIRTFCENTIKHVFDASKVSILKCTGNAKGLQLTK